MISRWKWPRVIFGQSAYVFPIKKTGVLYLVAQNGPHGRVFFWVLYLGGVLYLGVYLLIPPPAPPPPPAPHPRRTTY